MPALIPADESHTSEKRHTAASELKGAEDLA